VLFAVMVQFLLSAGAGAVQGLSGQEFVPFTKSDECTGAVSRYKVFPEPENGPGAEFLGRAAAGIRVPG
jgi:hypothetical protein